MRQRLGHTDKEREGKWKGKQKKNMEKKTNQGWKDKGRLPSKVC